MNNKKYTSYDKKTGEIIMLFQGDELLAEANAPYIEGHYSKDEYIIKNGAPVRKDEEVIRSSSIKNEWIKVRNKRNMLLQNSDWTQLPDSVKDRTAWAEYRSKLRDITETYQDPFSISWPVPPK